MALVAAANLRGLRESGNIFALPTYLFIVSALLVIGLGVLNTVTGNVHPVAKPETPSSRAAQVLTLLLLGRAFAGGSVALTGVEAIADGVPAFKPPEPKNAANTLVAMATAAGRPVRRHDIRRPAVQGLAHRRRSAHGPGPGRHGRLRRRPARSSSCSRSAPP